MNNCIICFKDNISNEIKVKCGHSFCKKCIIKWAYKNNSCPICRKRYIMFSCNHCDKIYPLQKNQHKNYCKPCDFLMTDLKMGIRNLRKLKKDLKKRYKKLSIWKKFKIKMKNLTFRKIINKILKITSNTLLFFTGLYQVKSGWETPYHGLILLTHIIITASIPLGSPFVGLIMFTILGAIGNAIALLFYILNPTSERELASNPRHIYIDYDIEIGNLTELKENIRTILSDDNVDERRIKQIIREFFFRIEELDEI